MEKSIFSYDSYKQYLKDYIKASPRSGAVSQLANFAGCARTYLSQVLAGKVQLTADHALALGQGLQFSEAEQNQFLLLVLYDRASTPKARAALQHRIEKGTRENTAVTKRVKEVADVGELSDAMKSRYYSSWQMGAVHLLTSISDYQTATAIAEKLSLPVSRVQQILLQLVEMRLVDKIGARYQHNGKHIHIERNSPANGSNHLNWRLRAVEDANNEDSVHYTMMFSISQKDWSVLKNQLLEFIQKQLATIHKSGAEELHCFCCDLFSVAAESSAGD